MNINTAGMGKRICVLLAVALVLSACGPGGLKQVTPAPTRVPQELISAFEVAYNQHDSKTALGFFTSISTFDAPNWQVSLPGWSQLRYWVEYSFGRNAQVHFTDCRASGDTFTCQLAYTDECLSAARIDPYHMEAVFSMSRSMITRLAWQNDQEADLARYAAFQEEFLAWMKTSHPDEYDQLTEGKFTQKLGEATAQYCRAFATDVQ
jgi:hypothetical protein